MLFKNGKMKNISKSQVLTLKDEVAYQEGMVVSKTLVQNDAVSVTLFLLIKERKSALTNRVATHL